MAGGSAILFAAYSYVLGDQSDARLPNVVVLAGVGALDAGGGWPGDGQTVPEPQPIEFSSETLENGLGDLCAAAYGAGGSCEGAVSCRQPR